MRNLAGELIMDDDRRGATRQDVEEAALTITKGKGNAVNCVVKDISDNGARIVFDEEAQFVPKRLKLYVADRHIIAECEQVWRNGCEIGLKFYSVVSVG
jgi:hypothetical protein